MSPNSSMHDLDSGAIQPVSQEPYASRNPKATLGTVQLRHVSTNQIILVPTPANDPNDPLNWSRAYRCYIAGLACYTTFLTLFSGGGNIIALVPMAEYFFGPIPFTSPKLIAAVAKASYFFTSTALLLGVGNLFWMPIVIKYGRRPVYIASFIGFFLTTIWAGLAKSFSSELAARILMGFVAGAGDCVAPVTLSDIFFLHERGTVMAWYTMSTAIGVGLGTCLDGLVLISYDWRYTYYINIALVGSAMLALIFTMPETLYLRSKMPVPSAPQNVDRVPIEKELGDVEGDAAQVEHANERNEAPIPAKHTYWQRHNFHHGSHTKESLWELFIRPVFLLVLPSVLWSSLVFAVNIGFYIAVSSNAALGFQQAYGFQAYQTGLCFLGTVIGGVLGVAAGGVLTDKVADFFTRRNGGLRDPEMRLPAITISVVVGPIALMLYGVGLGHRLPWIVPTIGLSLLNFVLVQATTISLVYSIDSYRPIGGEVVVTQLALKAAFSFLLSFYTNTWIAELGEVKALGCMTGIYGFVLLLATPLYFYGKSIRRASIHWKAMKFVVWDEDRETGE